MTLFHPTKKFKSGEKMHVITPTAFTVLKHAFPLGSTTVHSSESTLELDTMPASANRHLMLRPKEEVTAVARGEERKPLQAQGPLSEKKKVEKTPLLLIRTEYGDFWYFASCFEAKATAMA